jgi:hypothetical protein
MVKSGPGLLPLRATDVSVAGTPGYYQGLALWFLVVSLMSLVVGVCENKHRELRYPLLGIPPGIALG